MSPKASRASTSLSPLSESLFARSPTALGLGIFSLPHSAKQSRVLAGALAADYSPVARGPQDPKSHRFSLSPPCLFLKQMFRAPPPAAASGIRKCFRWLPYPRHISNESLKTGTGEMTRPSEFTRERILKTA